jgi:hypothetical protein
MNNIWKKILSIKPYYFFIVLVITTSVCVLSLRSNNEHMGQLREKVFAADQSGNGVPEALNNLRNYVNSHMNTSLSAGNTSVYPPIQLQYTYQRLVSQQSSQSSSNQANVYHDAQVYCQQQNSSSFSGRTRIPCVQAYITSHGQSPIPQGLFEFDFQSPGWSPDLAGWSMLVSIFILCLFVLDLIYWIRKKQQIKTDKP